MWHRVGASIFLPARLYASAVLAAALFFVSVSLSQLHKSVFGRLETDVRIEPVFSMEASFVVAEFR